MRITIKNFGPSLGLSVEKVDQLLADTLMSMSAAATGRTWTAIDSVVWILYGNRRVSTEERDRARQKAWRLVRRNETRRGDFQRRCARAVGR